MAKCGHRWQEPQHRSGEPAVNRGCVIVSGSRGDREVGAVADDVKPE
ncbi:Uncharacterised protein [Mycobacteroides abscessus subsp. abscessus]|nr:Uncharacterised protein [Mycobacteroides abscessus subsp. abscessus]